jgi:hypothetical protein
MTFSTLMNAAIAEEHRLLLAVRAQERHHRERLHGLLTEWDTSGVCPALVEHLLDLVAQKAGTEEQP